MILYSCSKFKIAVCWKLIDIYLKTSTRNKIRSSSCNQIHACSELHRCQIHQHKAASQDQDYTQQIGARGGSGRIASKLCSLHWELLISDLQPQVEHREEWAFADLERCWNRNDEKSALYWNQRLDVLWHKASGKGWEGLFKASSLPPMAVYTGRAEPRYSNTSRASLPGAESCIT